MPVSKREFQTVLGWSVAVMAATCIPYLLVWWYTPLQGVFPWTLFNSDDHGVYFAWMRQALDGHLLFRNLFTTEPQRGIYLHPYFLLLGQLARIPGIDIPLAYQIGRLVFGVTTLLLVYRLGALFTEDRFTRGCIFWTTALSAGFGWLLWHDRVIQRGPVDIWQAEAVTFASLYTTGLFAVSLTLMLGFVICLLLAETRGLRWAVFAGLCGLVLGNIHSYDMIHLAAIWSGYLGLRWVVTRRFPASEFRLALLAGAIAAPSVLYMYWFYKTEPVFQARANVPTLTPPLSQYLLGYGLLLPLAAVGAWRVWPLRSAEDRAPDLRCLLPVVWGVLGLAIAYLPVPFQRKLVMGYHLPLGLLSGVAIAWLAGRVTAAPRLRVAAAGLVVAVLSLSNVRYPIRDVQLALTANVTSTGAHPAYWDDADIHAFTWLHDHTPPSAVLFTLPTNGVFAPAYSGRTVYAGHWGETPGFDQKFREALHFYSGEWSSEERREFLRSRGITHVLQFALARAIPNSRPLASEPFLHPVFTERDTVLYEVR
jgi:arabinosyltransferase C